MKSTAIHSRSHGILWGVIGVREVIPIYRKRANMSTAAVGRHDLRSGISDQPPTADETQT